MRRPKRLPLEELAPYLLDRSRDLLERSRDREGAGVDPPLPHGRGSDALDWQTLFGNNHPVEIEVGCGKGAFLVAAAQAHPETNYLGIELIKALQLYIVTRLAKRGLRNARVASTDARRFLHDCVPAASVRAVHVYFPDPWWKKRHQKRRVWTPDFAADCVRVLVPGGRLHVATDVPEYYEIIRGLLDGCQELKRLWDEETSGTPTADEALTNFERKARQGGGAVWRAEYERAAH